LVVDPGIGLRLIVTINSATGRQPSDKGISMPNPFATIFAMQLEMLHVCLSFTQKLMELSLAGLRPARSECRALTVSRPRR
jgi:hypothetical protein